MGLSEAHKPKTEVFLFWICDHKTFESFADNYITNYDVACFYSVNNRTVVQLPLAARPPHGCREPDAKPSMGVVPTL